MKQVSVSMEIFLVQFVIFLSQRDAAENNDSTTYEEARRICQSKLNSSCSTYRQLESTSTATNLTQLVEDCAKDVKVCISRKRVNMFILLLIFTVK